MLSSDADARMVAHDWALEIPFEEVQFAQKRVVAECANCRIDSMVGRQLLHSMRESALPTHAEVPDIGSVVLDGADALVVSGETAYCRHPVPVVDVLRKVIIAAKRQLTERPNA